MKPINTAERSSAFLYFLILFIITTSLVVLTVFFGMQVPFKQNDKLQHQLGMYQNEKSFAESFSTKMTDTKILLDSINRAGTQADLVNGQISSNLVDLNAMIEKDTSGVKKIYQDIVHNLLDLQTAKAQLRDAGNKDAAVGQYLQQIEDLRSQLNSKTQEADALRLQLISLSH